MGPIDALRCGIVGVGQVGRALLEDLAGRPPAGLRVVCLADSRTTLWDPRGLDLAGLLASKRSTGRLPGGSRHTLERLAGGGELDLVVDLSPTELGTGEPSLSLHRHLAAQGVHLVTANKGPLALAGPSIRAAFERAGARLAAEATVGGGLPVLSTIERLAQGDRITAIRAVANRSTTDVLERIEGGRDLPTAIDEARALGILEADPMLDLTGLDAAAKAAILSQVAFERPRTLRDVEVDGVLGLDGEQVAWHRTRGHRVRLVASITPERARVAPVPLPSEHPLVGAGAGNAYVVELERGGRVTLAGPGAGPAETASAVRRDVVELLSTLASGRDQGPASAANRNQRTIARRGS